MLAIEDWIERASAGEASVARVVVHELKGRVVAEPQWKHPVVRGDHIARHAREVFKGRARSAA